MLPNYDLNKIRFATDASTFKKTVGLYENGKVTQFKAEIGGFSAIAARRYIKPYNGPSRIWFSYQNSLQEGCNRLSAIVSNLPVNKQTALLLVDMLLRLDKKLSSGGVDDSNGTVGGFIEETVEVLKQYTELDPACALTFRKLQNRETCFGWERPLLELINSNKRKPTPGVD